MNTSTLAAFAISRRLVAIAIFSHARLEHVRTRELNSSAVVAERQVVHFASRALHQFAFMTAAVEAMPDQATRSAKLRTILVEFLRSNAVSIHPVGFAELAKAYSSPPIASKHQLRKIILQLWPALNDERIGGLGLDCAAIGLHAQVAKLLVAAHAQS